MFQTRSAVIVLVELGGVEQPHAAVLAVLNDGDSVVEVARRFGVTRKVDSGGGVSFAGFNYKVGKRHARRQVQVAIVGDTVEISAGGEILRVHPIKHDRSREHGAFANAGDHLAPIVDEGAARRIEVGERTVAVDADVAMADGERR